jgi:hypothetical protein
MKKQYGISIVLRNNGTYMTAYTLNEKSFLGEVVFTVPSQSELIFQVLSLICKALNESVALLSQSNFNIPPNNN